MQTFRRAGAAAAAFWMTISGMPAAFAACPIELATYADTHGTGELEFASGKGGATGSNDFRLLLDNNVVLNGAVQSQGSEPRPWGRLMYRCPEGELTAEELAACTVWEGVIYTSDGEGNIGLLPDRGGLAPHTIILAGLGPALRVSAAYGADGFSQTPWDVFALKGCQE
jgi:hypothetical protein